MNSDKHKFQDKMEITVEEYYQNQYYNVVQLIKELQKKIGKKQTSEIVRPLFERMFVEWGKEEGKKNNINSLEAFVKYDGRAFTQTQSHEVKEQSSSRYLSHVTECILANILRNMDDSEIGYDILCNTDFECYPAMNPKLKLTRTMTLMQGDPHCDFLFT
jgi:hypothetical protein